MQANSDRQVNLVGEESRWVNAIRTILLLIEQRYEIHIWEFNYFQTITCKDNKCKLLEGGFTRYCIVAIGLNRFPRFDFNHWYLDVFTILQKSNHEHLYLFRGLITLSLGGDGHHVWRRYKTSSKEPSSFFSRAQSPELWYVELAGLWRLLKVSATKRK